MSKLLRANFTRLVKSRIFWICILFMASIGIISTITQYREMMTMTDYTPNIDNILFSGCMFMPIVSAVFVGLFLGTEYGDGTIRNKLIVGHERGAVYFSNFIVCAAALLLMHLVYIAVIVAVGVPLVGNAELPVTELVVMGLASLATALALTAIFVLMGMLIHGKAACCVAAMLLGMAMIMSATMIYSRLHEPEYYDEYRFSVTDEAGNVHEEQSERQKNPLYLTGIKRQVYEFLYDFLPGCQMVRISYCEPVHSAKFPLYSFGITIVVTACGVFFFRRKNIN